MIKCVNKIDFIFDFWYNTLHYNMSTHLKQLIINKFILPKELLDIIKDYIFPTIQKIQKNDKRYKMLLTIPEREYDPSDGVAYVYMTINDVKDYFLTYKNGEIQLQTFLYNSNTSIITRIAGYSVKI